MCGRYTVTNPGAALAGLLDDPLETAPRADLAAVLRPRFNVAPTQEAPVVRRHRDRGDRPGRRELAALRWGLVPSFAENPSIGARMINARAESVVDKPAFRDCLSERRCLIPADGFYEWRPDPLHPRRRQPYFIHAPARRPFAFAGLWARWRSGATTLETFTILTTQPTAFLATLHDRMPLILRPSEHALWLDGDEDAARAWLASLPAREGLALEAYPVSRRVNGPKDDDPGLILPAEPAEPSEPAEPTVSRPQLELF